MRLLIDTHVLIWTLSGDPRLNEPSRSAIDEAEKVFVSAIAVLEIAIKRRKNQLEAPDDLLDRLPRLGFDVLPVTAEHAWAVGGLPSIHGDPFDRLMAAQSKVEKITLMTADEMLSRYDIDLMIV